MFEEFWRRLADSRLNAHEEMPVEAILERVLGTWRTCAVCDLLWERAFYLASRWQYLLAEDPATQARFVESQTWCNRHAWFFKEVASPRTLGRLHRRLHARVIERMNGLLKRDLSRLTADDPAQIFQDLVGERACRLCGDEAAFREVVLSELARGLASGALRSAFAVSAGCCLPHLAALLCTLPDGDTARYLLDTTVDQLSRSVKELDIYEAETENRKRRYGSAADAPTRALVNWAGQRGMGQVWHERETLSRAPWSGGSPAAGGTLADDPGGVEVQ
ncbi:MAG: hypothetical protein ACHQ7N_06735 [Candidatus Methylomirabilales bacterium]